MSKKVIKIISLLIVIIICMSTVVSAASFSEIIDAGKSFVNAGNTNKTIIKETGDNSIQTLSNTIYNILLSLGVVTAVIIAAVLGLKFMIGSAEEQADIKGKMVPFIIGCIVIFGAFGIWKAVVTLMQSTRL